MSGIQSHGTHGLPSLSEATSLITLQFATPYLPPALTIS